MMAVSAPDSETDLDCGLTLAAAMHADTMSRSAADQELAFARSY